MSGSNSLQHHSVQLNGIKQHFVKAGAGPVVMLLMAGRKRGTSGAALSPCSRIGYEYAAS